MSQLKVLPGRTFEDIFTKPEPKKVEAFLKLRKESSNDG